MRTAKYVGGDPQFKPTFVDSDVIRSDRMNDDPILIMREGDVNLNFELYYAEDGDPLSEFLMSGLFSTWNNSPTFFNDGTADSVVTDAGTTTDTYAVVSGGAAVVAGHLVRATGFTNAANNQIFRAASSTATTIVGSGLSLTAETAPPGTAKLKVVGFAGASGDITATATGLGSTTLDFTTLGLAAGMWAKIGGTAAGDQFATAALNDFARITAIGPTALTLDNLPTGWTTDSGTGKTIKVWFGDWIMNGVTKTGQSIEFGYLGQTTPTYVLVKGQVPNTINVRADNRNKIMVTTSFLGMAGAESQTAADASPDDESTAAAMASHANVARISEGGARITGYNSVRSWEFTINNNLRKGESIDQDSPFDIFDGEFGITGTSQTYFGDDTLLAKLFASTVAGQNMIVRKNGQAMVFDIPRATYRDGSPGVSGKNADVFLPLAFSASKDPSLAAHLIINRMPYYEA